MRPSMRDLAVLETAAEVERFASSRASLWLDGSERWVEWKALAYPLPSSLAECSRLGDNGVAVVVSACCDAILLARAESQAHAWAAESLSRLAVFEVVEQCRKLAMLYGTPELVERLAGVWRAFE